MHIELYSIKRKSNVANKLKHASPVYSGEVEPYGVINASGGNTFKLDRYVDCNYCKYTFGSKTFYGWVTISTNANGLYSYTVNVDALTTCYYAGDIKGNQMIARDSTGNSKLYDDAIPTESFVTNYKYNLADFDDRAFFVVNVINAPLYWENDYSTNMKTNAGVITYLLDHISFRDFVRGLTQFQHSSGTIDASRLFAMTSILSIYAIDYSDIIFNSLDSVSNVQLYHYNDIAGATFLSAPVDIPVTNLAYRVPFDYSYKIDFDKYLDTESFMVDRDSEKDIIVFDIRNCGIINVNASSIPPSKIEYLGYRKIIDFAGGNIRCYPRINQSVRYDVEINCRLAEQVPILYANDMFNPFEGVQQIMNITSGPSGAISSLSGLYDSFFGKNSVMGTTTGSVYRAGGLDTFVLRKHYKKITPSAYRALFGCASNEVKDISTLTGYIQTINCKIESTYSEDLTSTCEKLCDSGIYVI